MIIIKLIIDKYDSSNTNWFVGMSHGCDLHVNRKCVLHPSQILQEIYSQQRIHNCNEAVHLGLGRSTYDFSRTASQLQSYNIMDRFLTMNKAKVKLKVVKNSGKNQFPGLEV